MKPGSNGFGLTSESLNQDEIKRISDKKCVVIERKELKLTLDANRKVRVSKITTQTGDVKKVILEAKRTDGPHIKVGHYLNMSMQIVSAYQRL